jgi:apolipoprotein D and lipocalin family protein
MTLWKLVLMSVGCFAFLACAPTLTTHLPPLTTVPFVDLDRYVGKWYEIASYPTPFNEGCTATTAEYTALDDGTIGVVNECRIGDPSGELNRIEGTARIVNETTNAQLKVSFFIFAEGDYWIIDLDEEYQWAVVGDPIRSTLFILSRTPTLDDTSLQGILSRLPEKCYDPDYLAFTVQPTQ